MASCQASAATTWRYYFPPQAGRRTQARYFTAKKCRRPESCNLTSGSRPLAFWTNPTTCPRSVPPGGSSRSRHTRYHDGTKDPHLIINQCERRVQNRHMSSSGRRNRHAFQKITRRFDRSDCRKLMTNSCGPYRCCRQLSPADTIKPIFSDGSMSRCQPGAEPASLTVARALGAVAHGPGRRSLERQASDDTYRSLRRIEGPPPRRQECRSHPWAEKIRGP